MRQHYNKMNVRPHVLNLTDHFVSRCNCHYSLKTDVLTVGSGGVREQCAPGLHQWHWDDLRVCAYRCWWNQEGQQNGEQCRHWPSPTALTGGAGVEFVEEPGRGDMREPAELSADEGWLWGQLTDFHGPSQLPSICSILFYFFHFFGFR